MARLALAVAFQEQQPAEPLGRDAPRNIRAVAVVELQYLPRMV